jgi:TonB family protein
MFETSISTSKKQRLRGSAASALLHCALAIILFTMAVPEAAQRRVRASLVYMPRSGQAVAQPEIARRPFKRIVLPRFAPAIRSVLRRPLGAALTLPDAPAIPAPPAPQIALSLPPIPAVPLPAVAFTDRTPRKPEIRTGEFESPAPPALRPTALKAQPSGFDSAATQPAGNSRGAVAPGEVFGGAETVAAPAPRREIAAAQFDAVAAKPSRRGSAPTAISGMRSPLEITSKPRPLYTEEARRLRIEGDVLLQVVFRASSEICVLRVIRGLGHGLDENAISAAAAIRFRPATEGGRPIDDVATVRITFQLAE